MAPPPPEPEPDYRPLIAVVNSWGEVCPGHFGLDLVARKVKEGVWQAGATPVEFGTISQCGTLTLGLDGIRYDLATREMVSFDIVDDRPLPDVSTGSCSWTGL